MNLTASVRAWLEGGSYLHGVALYQQTGGPYPIRTFLGYENAPYVPERIENLLRSALLQYLESQPLPSGNMEDNSRKHKAEKNAIPWAISAQNIPDEPAEIIRLRAEAKVLHKKQAFLHARIGELAEPDDRYPHIEEMMETVIPALDQIYDAIRKWHQTGEVPVEGEPDASVVQDTVKKMLRVKYLTERISRLNGLLKKKPDQKTRQQYEKELLEKQVEKKELEEYLGLT